MNHLSAWGGLSSPPSPPPVYRARARKPAPRGGGIAVLLLAAALLPRCVSADETVLSRPNWGQGEKGLDGWEVTGPVLAATADPQQGSLLTFGPGGLTSPKLPVAGDHRIRFRYRFSRVEGGTLYASVRQYRQGQQLPGFYQIWAQHPAIADLSLAEIGFTTLDEADAFDVIFSGPLTTLARLQVVDLGPPPEVKPDAKELIPNGGWEDSAAHAAIGAESSYFQGPGWMGWGADASKTIINVPSRVHGGKQALMVLTGSGAAATAGFRWLPAIPAVPDAWYDFSVWVKGAGMVSLWYLIGGDWGDSYATTNGDVMVSPDDWRQLHYVMNMDNPAHRGFTMGAFVKGRVFLDDLSLRQITRAQADAFRAQMAQYPPAPPRVAQTVPAGETSSPTPVTLENAYVSAQLSPVGGGHVVQLTDKQTGATWKGSLLGLTFPDQPVPIDWNIPFRTEVAPDGHQVTFSHTVTGGAAAPFLDGIRIEQVFALGPDDRALRVTWRLTNTAAGQRLPNPAVSTVYGADAGVRRLATYGDQGLLTAETAPASTRNLAAGWMAASAEQSSLVCVFDVTAAQDGYLDPKARSLSWNYLRLTLPPGGAWETTAWLAVRPLSEVEYADRNLAVQAALDKTGDNYRLTVTSALLTATSVLHLSARVVDYGGNQLAAVSAEAPATFPEPGARFITDLDLSSPLGKRTVELFNDPRGNRPDPGIQGASEVQYRPTVPARVLRLPDIGDLRGQIGQSSAALWAKGIWFQYYPLDAPLQKAGLRVESLDGAAGFPEEVEELAAYRLVILNNLGAAQLTPAARAALAQYVRAGGRLLVLGGSLGLGNALTTGTDLEDLLPATLSGPFDTVRLSGDDQLLHPVKGSGLGPLPWTDRPRLYWCHRVTPRPEATLLALAGKAPVLLEGPYGRGRVRLYAGTVEGEAGAGETAAWAWAGWPQLWEMMVSGLLAP